jgi:hypothetical protein
MTNSHICFQTLLVFHKNVCELKHKWNQLLVPTYPDLPHVLCITERQMNKAELYSTNNNYTLGANYCSNSSMKG